MVTTFDIHIEMSALVYHKNMNEISKKILNMFDRMNKKEYVKIMSRVTGKILPYGIFHKFS